MDIKERERDQFQATRHMYTCILHVTRSCMRAILIQFKLSWQTQHSHLHLQSHSASSQFGWGRNAKKCLPAQCNITVYGHICMSFYMCSLVSCVCGDQVRSYLYTVCVVSEVQDVVVNYKHCKCVRSYSVSICNIYLCKVPFVYSMCSVVSGCELQTV